MNGRWVRSILLALFGVGIAYFLWCMLRTLPNPQLSLDISSPTAVPFNESGVVVNRAAVGYIDPLSGQAKCRPFGSHGDNLTPRATASIIKLLTVQVILSKKPLNINEQGPTITMTAEDEARYHLEMQNGGSYVPVIEGQKLSQHQLIEGILLASANNMANSLAVWAFGSLDNYRIQAQKWLKEHNLHNTIVGSDASGFNESSKSTPNDICQLLAMAIKNPLIVNIMGSKEVTTPSGLVVHNTNHLLGEHGVFAGKTGYNDEAGRGFTGAAKRFVGEQPIKLIAVSLSNDSYKKAFDVAAQLFDVAEKNLRVINLPRHRVVGRMQSSWGSSVPIVVSSQLLVTNWVDQKTQASISLNHNIANLDKNSIVGQVDYNGQRAQLLSAGKLEPAGIFWRLSHPL